MIFLPQRTLNCIDMCTCIDLSITEHLHALAFYSFHPILFMLVPHLFTKHPLTETTFYFVENSFFENNCIHLQSFKVFRNSCHHLTVIINS